MIDCGKRNVLGTLVNVIDYDSAVGRIMDAAAAGLPCSVSALAVHGVMTGVLDAEHRHRLNQLDIVAPDGQPVRWALRLLHGDRLPDRVYGPELMLRICRQAAVEKLPIFLFGSTGKVVDELSARLRGKNPGLAIAGSRPSRFKRLTDGEMRELIGEIKSSGAKMLFVGLGCPRQEIFTFEVSKAVNMPVIAVGAAYDFHAGLLPQAPPWMQKRGLEWFFRLLKEPRRLWRRYLLLNPAYIVLVAMQSVGLLPKSLNSSRKPQANQNFG